MQRTALLGFSLLASLALSGCGGGGGTGSSGSAALLAHVPKNAVGASYVRVADILALPAFKQHEAKIKELAAENADQMKPEHVQDALMAFVPTGGGKPMPYEPVAVVRFKDPAFKAYLEKQYAESETIQHAGKSYLKHKTSRRPVLYFPDATTAVFAEEPLLKTLLDEGGGGGACAELLARPHMQGHVQVVGVATGEKEKIEGALSGLPLAFMPAPLAGLGEVPKLVDRTALSLDLNGDKFLVAELTAADADKAKQMQAKLKDGLDFGLKTLAEDLLPSFAKRPEGAEMVKHLQPVVDDLKTGATVTQDGTRVTLTAPLSAKARESLAGMVSPLMKAADQARASAERMERMHNIKMAGLGAQLYLQQQNTLPANVAGPDGKPLLSWRVHVVDVMAFGPPLSGKLALDKAWDSPENLAVSKTDKGEVHKTRLAAFTGPGTLFDGDRSFKVAEIRDGTANTILFVEVGPEKAIPWTQPADIPFDPANPIAALGELPDGGFHVVMCDGSARWIPKTIKPAILAALITPDGGEPVDLSELDGN